MPKTMTLILRLKYSHKKYIKINYETQFLTDSMLNDKIKDTKNNSSQLGLTR
jgi:hypothetical protein